MKKDVVYTREVDGISLLLWTVLRLIWAVVSGIFFILFTIFKEVLYPLTKWLCKNIYQEILKPCAKYIKRKWSGVEEIEYQEPMNR